MILDPPILQCKPACGIKGAVRYVIQNLKNEQVWTADGFSPDWGRALLYAHPNEACQDMREIMMQVYEGRSLNIYEAPCRVEVFGEAEMRHVQQWLSRATVFKLRTDDLGNGPGNSLVLPVVHWQEMEPMTDET